MYRRDVLLALAAGLGGCLSGSPPASAPTTSGGTPTRDTPTSRAAPPDARFAFEWHPDARELVVAHDGGEPVRARDTDRLEVEITTHPDRPIPEGATLTPTRTPTTWSVAWPEAAGGDPYPVTAGDSVVVEGATPGDDARVVWAGTRGGSAVLGGTTLPKAGR